MKIRKVMRSKIPCDVCGLVPRRGLKLIGERVHCPDCLVILHTRVAAHVANIGGTKMLNGNKCGDEKYAAKMSGV